jgi:hypothetical protein
VKAEVILPDRKHAKLWSVMRHKEHADEAPLPAAHALSGCDTTSSFFGIGKKSVYKILKAPDFHDLDNLGDPDKDVEAPLLKVVI